MFIRVLNLRKIKKVLKRSFLLLVFALFLPMIFYVMSGNGVGSAADISAMTGKVIIIDAGHGGEDPGAIGVNGVYEKDINLALATLIGEDLKSKGYTVIYTRTSDKMLYLPEENIKGMRKISDLKNRCKITAEYDDPIVISIHVNSFGASKYSGLQVYYKNDSDTSNMLANKIQNNVRATLQQSNNRQVKNGKNIYLLDNCNGSAVLIECGFISNNDECQKLSQKEYQKELSFSIVCGIIEYIEEKDGV